MLLFSLVAKPCVYFLSNAELTYVKIGKSTALEQRLRGIQSCMPWPGFLAASIEGFTRVELWLHNRFLSDRLNGEWFHVSEPIAATIKLAQDLGPSASEMICPEALVADRADLEDKRGQYERALKHENNFPTYDEMEQIRQMRREQYSIDEIFYTFKQKYERSTIDTAIRRGSNLRPAYKPKPINPTKLKELKRKFRIDT